MCVHEKGLNLNNQKQHAATHACFLPNGNDYIPCVEYGSDTWCTM